MIGLPLTFDFGQKEILASCPRKVCANVMPIKIVKYVKPRDQQTIFFLDFQ